MKQQTLEYLRPPIEGYGEQRKHLLYANFQFSPKLRSAFIEKIRGAATVPEKAEAIKDMMAEMNLRYRTKELGNQEGYLRYRHEAVKYNFEEVLCEALFGETV